ncbi:hypothetical protein U1Q18_006792 [Sarracenia purpurea var. burkii]
MVLAQLHNLFVLLNILSFILSDLPYSHGDAIDSKILNVGEELWKETLPLQMGSRLYRLEGLKSHTWYEVKISYPASVSMMKLLIFDFSIFLFDFLALLINRYLQVFLYF